MIHLHLSFPRSKGALTGLKKEVLRASLAWLSKTFCALNCGHATVSINDACDQQTNNIATYQRDSPYPEALRFANLDAQP